MLERLNPELWFSRGDSARSASQKGSSDDHSGLEKQLQGKTFMSNEREEGEEEVEEEEEDSSVWWSLSHFVFHSFLLFHVIFMVKVSGVKVWLAT